MAQYNHQAKLKRKERKNAKANWTWQSQAFVFEDGKDMLAFGEYLKEHAAELGLEEANIHIIRNQDQTKEAEKNIGSGPRLKLEKTRTELVAVRV